MARRVINRPTLSPEESLKRTERAYRLWLKGYGLRQLAKICGIPRSTLSRRFKLLYGVGYSQRRNTKGLVRIFQEYKQSRHLTRQQQIEVQRFLINNLDSIADMEAQYPDPLYNDRELQKRTNHECCRGQDDFAVYIDRFYYQTRPLSSTALRRN